MKKQTKTALQMIITRPHKLQLVFIYLECEPRDLNSKNRIRKKEVLEIIPLFDKKILCRHKQKTCAGKYLYLWDNLGIKFSPEEPPEVRHYVANV